MFTSCPYCGGAYHADAISCDHCGAPRRRPSDERPPLQGVMKELLALLKKTPHVRAFAVAPAVREALMRELVYQRRFVNTIAMDEFKDLQAIEFNGIPVFADRRLPGNMIQAIREGQGYPL